MYPRKPDWKAPESAADFTRFIHQSTIGDVQGPFACHAQLKYKAIDGYRSKPAKALSYGTAWDRMQYAVAGTTGPYATKPETLDGYFREKQKSGEDMPEKDVKEVFDQVWTEEASELEDLKEGEKDDLLKRGFIAIGGAWMDIAKTLQPHKLHTEFSVPMQPDQDGDEWFLRGSVDMSAYKGDSDKPHLRDAKTSGKSWSLGVADNKVQAPHYSIGAINSSSLEGVDPDKFTFEVMVKNKTKANVSEHVVKIDDLMRTTHLRRTAIIRDIMRMLWKTGDFLPNRDSMTCSRSNCGYWSACEREFGGTVRGVEV